MKKEYIIMPFNLKITFSSKYFFFKLNYNYFFFTGNLQKHEIKETDKTINIKEDLNVDMKHATDDSKIIDRSQG